jgi:sugar phosphate permease
MQQRVSWSGIINFILVGFFLFFEMGVQVAPNVMAHDMMRTLPLHAGALSIMSSVYFYSYTLMMVPVGLLYDRFRLQYLLVIALLAVAAGNALFATMPDVMGLS